MFTLFEHFLFHLLKAKIHAIAAIPVMAALIVLGTTGFVVTGTVDKEGDTVELTVRSLEDKTCVDALIAQTETLLMLDVLAADATGQLRRLRDRAREQADDAHKVIDETALRAQLALSSDRIREELAAARKLALDEADLSKCQDGDPKTGIVLDVADLRVRYDRILRDFGTKLNGVLSEAQVVFDNLVATAQPKAQRVGSTSHSSD